MKYKAKVNLVTSLERPEMDKVAGRNVVMKRPKQLYLKVGQVYDLDEKKVKEFGLDKFLEVVKEVKSKSESKTEEVKQEA